VDLELDVLSARQDFECLRETAEMQGWLPDAGANTLSNSTYLSGHSAWQIKLQNMARKASNNT